MHYMELHAPIVEIDGCTVKIAYSLGRGEDENGWTCDQVFICVYWEKSLIVSAD